MSRRDVETVAQLAAHLATITAKREYPTLRGAGCVDEVADALALQRLARNIRNKARDIGNMPWGTYLRIMTDKAEAILKPYGLVAELSAEGIRITDIQGAEKGEFWLSL